MGSKGIVHCCNARFFLIELKNQVRPVKNVNKLMYKLITLRSRTKWGLEKRRLKMINESV
ncbi:hypothetical protein EMIT079MI2_170121 [Bacillus sp. IT-79MI2]